MDPYKTSILTLISTLALAGCPSDDTAGGDTESSGTETNDPTTGAGPSTDSMTDTDIGTDTENVTDTETPTDTDSDTDSAADGAAIRVVHASPGAPAVDVYVAGSSDPVITNLAYGETSDYIGVAADDYVFEVRATGEAADSDPVFSTETLTIAEGDSITAIAAGQVGGEGDAAFRILPLADGFDDAGDGAIARIVHAGSDAPAVDIDVGNDGSAEFEGVAPYADSGAAGVQLPAGEALQVGILSGGEAVTAFTTPELPAGAPLYIIATGLLNDLPRAETGFSLLAVGPEGSVGFIAQNPRVYGFHAGTDAPTVDVCADGAPLIEGLAFGALGGVQVPPGEYALDIHVTGDEPCAGDPAFTANTPALEAGEQYLAVAAGELTADEGSEGPDPDFTVEFFTEEFSYDPASADTNAVVVHAASAPSVVAGALDEAGEIPDPFFASLSFPNASGELTVAAGKYAVGIASSRGTPVPVPAASVLAAFGLAAPAGVSAFVVAHGSLDNTGDDQPFGMSAIVIGPTPWVALPLAAVGM